MLPWLDVCFRLLVRRGTAVTFTSDEASVLVSDRTGDVYRYPVAAGTPTDGQTDGELLLGHLSMVLDLVGSWC